jgi:hypothetical protein
VRERERGQRGRGMRARGSIRIGYFKGLEVRRSRLLRRGDMSGRHMWICMSLSRMPLINSGRLIKLHSLA